MTESAPDVRITNCGSIVQFEPVSQAARDWFDANVQSEGWQWLGNRLSVDLHYATALAIGIEDAGLTIE